MSKNTDFNIENFNGPLDLLLELVKDKHMDIFDINLAELATQYVELISKLKNTNIDLASEYLVMAATLLQIKAKMVLYVPGEEKVEDEDSEEILRKLFEYQQFKKVAEKLKVQEEERFQFFIKEREDYTPFEAEEDLTQLDGSVDPVKLISQMRKMFERLHAQRLRETTIEKFNLSPAERRIEIIALMKKKDKITFEDIFDVPSINHFVVTMLTILDMSRKQELFLKQEVQFGDIKIKKGIIND